MEQIAKSGTASHASVYKPRDLGNSPLAKLPTYMPIITLPDSEPQIYELPIPAAFEYFYGIPYDSVYGEKNPEK